jgi:predicted regulator of Ras-like GTPase activity (Roadblock/LC7/MglB family)
MKQVLDPLIRIAGVRKVVLVSDDGVPIAVQNAFEDDPAEGWGSSKDDLEALSGLAVGLVGDVRRSVDPLSWDPPQYMVLRAVHGTLALMRSPGSILLVILERGMQPEDLRVPMEAAVARVQRVLRRGASPEPPAPLPGRHGNPRAVRPAAELAENGVPRVAGER